MKRDENIPRSKRSTGGRWNNFSLDFLGVGAEKSGTTWLAVCLAEHPEVYLPKQTDLYFFNDLDRHFLKVENRRYLRGIDWYQAQFDNCKEGKMKGEYTPVYFYSKKAAKRIKKHFPGVKILVVLRNPAERAYSQYIHDKRLGVIKNLSFEEAIRIHKSYLEKGHYYKYLKYYYSVFPKKNILVILFSDIKDKPSQTVKKVYRFLGLSDINYQPSILRKRVNYARQARFPLLNYFMIHTEFLLRQKRADGLLKLLESSGIRRLALKIRELNSSRMTYYPKIRKKTKRELYQAFKKDTKLLEKLIDRNLASWRR